MKKLFFLMSALLIAVAANAFELRFQGNDKHEVITTATDNSDVLGDGKVSVSFNNSSVYVSLKDAELTTGNYQAVLGFEGDNTYKYLYIAINGDCSAKGPAPFAFKKCNVFIQSENPTDVLNVESESIVFNLQDVTLIIGNVITDAFTLNIKTTATGGNAVFYGSTGIDTYEALIFGFVNASITNANSVPLTANLEGLSANSLKLSDGVVIDDTNYIFQKDGSEYTGSLTMSAPYLISVGNDYLFPGDEANFKPAGLKNGTITYDATNKKLTLEDARLEDFLYTSIEGIMVYLKGYNVIQNPEKDPRTRLILGGKDSKLSGEENASLIIYCNSEAYVNGISADYGLEISDFKSITIYDPQIGIYGYEQEGSNNLIIRETGIILNNVKASAIAGFDAVQLDGGIEVIFPFTGATYSASDKNFHNENNGEVTKDLTIGYKSYGVTLGDIDVNVKNASDIKIEGATGKASFDNTTATLTLNNFKMADDAATYGFTNNMEVTIKLVGENILKGSQFGIRSYASLTIEGPGSLEAIGTYDSGINLLSEGTLTIKKSATVIASGEETGVSTEAMPMCMDEYDPETTDFIGTMPDGGAGTLTINNANLKATGTNTASIKGFEILNLTDAAITAPANAEFYFGCIDYSTDVLTGIVDKTSKDYITEQVVITQTGETDKPDDPTPATFKVTLVADHGTITVVEDGINLSAVPENTVLHFNATPDTGYKFKEWIGYNDATGLTVTADATVTAVFEKIKSALENAEGQVIVTKMVKDGQIVILRDGKQYNVLGAQIR